MIFDIFPQHARWHNKIEFGLYPCPVDPAQSKLIHFRRFKTLTNGGV